MVMVFSTYKSYKLAQGPIRAFVRNWHKELIKVSWEKPEIGWTKLNFDGSCKCKTGKASIGGVVRDHNAEFLLGYAEAIGRTNSTVAEFVALQRGLELVLENGYKDLWLEGDCKTLVEIVAQRRHVKCDEVQKRVSCINLILPEFRNCFVTHVYREGNRLADKLAQIGHQLKRPQIWHVTPREVLRVLNEDASGKVFYRRI
ncbi:hypothetical protein Ccrd_000884 [Cynara cardunculus var. scolymus]|uniref:RNase H type-1 domain-containing protein n=1 Tax=Cynara cardunculus var. scolymus TaxID=59895 RepID=A0A103XU93_CYNCS|nr:hypothetical protein Ccrd_000884 [Cynara cardunculus var. scolymus]